MKKIAYVVLAVLMILPVIVACGGTKTTEVSVPNVKLISYAQAYPEGSDTRDESLAEELFSAALTVQLEEGKTLTVKDVVDAYATNVDGAAVYDSNQNTYKKLADLSEGNGFFWFYKVNGADAGLNTEIQATDAIIIVYEKI